MDIFLIILAIIWIVFASISDLRKREVPNWLNFSLIIFALAYRAFFSIVNSDLMFFLYGAGGLLLFIGLGYIFYYARVFAGGDAKLFMALGAVLPSSAGLLDNALSIIYFILLLLFLGGIYGLLYSVGLALKNKGKFSKEFLKQVKVKKGLFHVSIIFIIISLVFVFFDPIFLILTFIFLFFPFLYIYAKALEESCMIKEIKSKELTEGDWLYENIRVGGKVVKPYWEGLSMQEVKLLQKYNKKVKIKQGIPFVPAFLLAFLALLILQKYSLFNLFIG